MSEYLDFEIYNIKASSGILKTLICEPDKLKCILLQREADLELNEFLNKIMSSIGISTEQQCNRFILEENACITFDDIFRHGEAKWIIGFGFSKNTFNIQANLKFREWNHFESFSLLLFDNIREINGSADLKRKLWDNLKTLKID